MLSSLVRAQSPSNEQGACCMLLSEVRQNRHPMLIMAGFVGTLHVCNDQVLLCCLGTFSTQHGKSNMLHNPFVHVCYTHRRSRTAFQEQVYWLTITNTYCFFACKAGCRDVRLLQQDCHVLAPEAAHCFPGSPWSTQAAKPRQAWHARPALHAVCCWAPH